VDRFEKYAEFFYSEERIERLVMAARRDVLDAYLEAIVFIKKEQKLQELEALISDGNFGEALEKIIEDRLLEIAADFIWKSVERSFLGGGEDIASFLSDGIGALVSWDGSSERAVAQLRTSKFELVREFTNQTTEMLRDVLVRGTTETLNPRTQARELVDSIGLTRRQTMAVRNYRRLLEERSGEALTRKLRDRRFDPSVRAAAAGKKTLTKAQIDRMVDRYRERYLRFRAETIARTEALRATHLGTHEIFEQAYDSGQLDRADVIETWFTARDERVRGSHAPMHKQKRLAGKPFESGLGNLLRFPTDPEAPAEDTIQCRCRKTWRIRAKVEKLLIVRKLWPLPAQRVA
jgi:hypothetical protein